MANVQPLKVIFHEVNSKNFWLPQHPLFVGINLSDMKKLRLRFESDTQIFDLEWETFVGTLIHSRILETGYCNNEIRMFNKLTQFVNVFIVKETIDVPKNYDGGVASTCQFSEDTTVVTLYVTDFFVKHYGLNLLEKFYFKPVYCLPLEKVVFLAKSDECYNWATQDNWCDKLSLSVCNPKKVLCRSGDVLLAMPKSFDIEGQPSISKILDLIAVECQPVAQGILTINTTVVVTKFKPDDCRIVKKPQEPVISFNTMLHVFSYCNSLLPYGLLLGSVNPFSVAVHKNLLRHSNKTIFHVKMLPQLPKMYLLTKKDISSIDPVNLIIVSDVSLKELNIVNGSWVKISMCICKDKQTKRKSWLTEDREPKEDGSNYSRATKKANSYSIDIESGIRTPADKVRLVRVFSINTDDESTDFPKFDIRNNVAFISPNLWFNLNKHPSSFLESAARLNCEGMLTQEDLPEDDLEKVEISPPYANELHLSLVQSPAYTSFSDLLLLSKYFEIDRYVVKGDILAIDSREDVSFHQELENSFYTKWPVVYYRVVLVEGPPSSLGYRAKKGHTYLYTVGTSQSYIPMTVDSFFSSVPYHPIWYSAEPPGILEYVEHLELLLTPFLNSESSRTKISPCILLSGPLGCGKLTIVKALSRRLNMHFYQVNCHEVTGDSPGSTENRLKAMLQKTAMFAPCILALKNVDAVGREKELLGDDPRVLSTFCNTIKCLNGSSTQWPVIIIATTSESHSKVLSVEFSGTFLHLIKVKPPNEKERKAMIEGFLEVCPRGNDVNASYLAQRTAGFVLGDFSALVSQAVWCAYRRIRKTVKDYSLSVEEEEDICYAGILLLQKDLLESLEFLQAKHAEAIGAPKIPNVHWEDIGGMSDIKQEILDTIQLPLQHPELMASGFHRSGLLLYGPPGTGKTLLAKAVATECSLNFLSVKGPELINMYVGQSEENVREVFQRARYATPCVIFFDELDSLAPHRGNSGDSGGVMDRVVSQLLAELDGLHKAAEVFVIGATNRPDLLDRALLRPGRFDRLVYVGIPEEKASRLKILKALTRKFTLGTDLDLEVLVDKCPPSLTGADFYSLCSNAMMNALGRNIHEIETGRINVSDARMVIEKRDFDVALQNLTPSVSPEELKKYQNIKL